MKVIIVDDSAATRFIITKILRGIGVETIVEAENGERALHVLHENPDISFALVDWNMPVMNGLELVQAIRQQPMLHTLPIMMVTTETEMANVVRALEAGANEYMMKPFTKDMMADKLKILGLVEESNT